MKNMMMIINMLFILGWGHTATVASEMSGMHHGGTFEKKLTVDGIRAEFQIMSLASMNMTDPDGASHHIMVKFFHESMNHQIKNAIGKIKVINPDKKTQLGNLKNYDGIYAANFTFDASGKYGIICLIRIDGRDHVYRFWYAD